MANRRAISDHFNGRRFHNPIPRSHGLLALLRWVTNRQQGKWTSDLRASYGPKPLAEVPSLGDAADELRITFVNHSTFLIQCFGVNILTDPIWSERASPFTWAGPKRMRAPGIRLQDLPRIHCVLLSHDHYDHMDFPTLRQLWKTHRPTFYTGLGNSRRLRGLGIDRVVEMDWWDRVQLPGGLRLTATPARHFSGRTPFDRDTTLWCSFMIEPPAEHAASGAIYFGADTGFGTHFEQIAKAFPLIRTAILPIGAYRPEWFMGEVHCSPAEAVEAHRILGAPTSVACHFGTFPLADDGEDEAVEGLHVAMKTKRVEGDFLVPEFGGTIEIESLAKERETMSGTEDSLPSKPKSVEKDILNLIPTPAEMPPRTKRRIGIHTSTSGGVETAAERAYRLGCNALQVFSSSPRQWKPYELGRSQCDVMSQLRAKYDLKPLVIHANYLINVAGINSDFHRKSVEAFRGEVERGLALCADYLVLHPGSWRGDTREGGLKRAAEALREATDGLDLEGAKFTVLIENTAGAEFSLGGSFEQVAELVSLLHEHIPVGACIDTCHTHVAGYDIVSEDGYAATMKHLDETVGLQHVAVWHCNDAKAAMGSKLDRHQHIGEGTIGIKTFQRLLNDPRTAHAAFLAETPIDEPLDDLRNVNALKACVDPASVVLIKSASKSKPKAPAPKSPKKPAGAKLKKNAK